MTYLILFMIKYFVSHKLFCIFATELKKRQEMKDFQNIENKCCTTNCDAYARGICPFWGESDKLNRCTRIKNYIEEVEDGKDN